MWSGGVVGWGGRVVRPNLAWGHGSASVPVPGIDEDDPTINLISEEQLSLLSGVDPRFKPIHEHLDELVAVDVRTRMREVADADPAAEDLLIELVRVLDKQLWMTSAMR